MDYFTSFGGPDSLSLQEMLDMDIKSEKELDEIFGIDSNLNFHELPAINLDEDSLGAPGDNNVWLTSSNDGSSLLGGDISNSMTSDLNGAETVMVCPNSVMPVTLIQVPYDKSAVKSEKSLLKPVMKMQPKNEEPPLISDRVSSHSTTTYIPMNMSSMSIFKAELMSEEEEDDDEEPPEDDDDEIFIPTFKVSQPARSKVRVNEPAARTISNASVVKRNLSINCRTVNNKRRVQDGSNGERGDLNMPVTGYPKPAYSYSCLIAMALKNSPSGNLPVSEIYNFMCEHFPYFKTAPNGWKNSVRHNLSLNKCFEKIEKPATNGSQRKGCLWAMNPNKINKMDEEVQKWSKKDKSAIRKSMVCPDRLDALERGQLATNFRIVNEPDSDEEGWTEMKQEDTEDDEEVEDTELTEEDVKEWANANRLSPDTLAAIPMTEEEYESDISLTDFDIEVAESLGEAVNGGSVNVRVKVATSPNGAFQPLLSGAYTVNSNTGQDTSPKRFKTVAGGTITGNYVYKPLGTSSMRRKSPMRHSLLSSLEADD